MKQKDHQDIIKQMADRLREHSVPYQEGAWERFKQVDKKKPKYLMLWPYLSAAAAILIVFVLFLKPEQSVPLVNELVEQNITDEHNEVNSFEEEESEVVDEKSSLLASSPNQKVEIQSPLIKQIGVVSDAVIENDNLDVNDFQIAKESPSIEEMIAFNDNEKEIQENTSNENTVVKKVLTEPSSIVSVQEEKKEPVDYLAVLSTLKEDNGFIEDKDISKKWSVGLDVSPNISSNNQVNMGGGIAFAYSVSSKVSISSGVSYLRLNVDRMPEISSQMSSAPYP